MNNEARVPRDEINPGLYEKVEPMINRMIVRFRSRRPNAEIETSYVSSPSAKITFRSGKYKTVYDPSELYSGGLTADQLLDRFIDLLPDDH